MDAYKSYVFLRDISCNYAKYLGLRTSFQLSKTKERKGIVN
jgi:hypothetical protein